MRVRQFALLSLVVVVALVLTVAIGVQAPRPAGGGSPGEREPAGGGAPQQQQAENVEFIGQFNTDGPAVDLAVAGGYAYVADDYGALHIIDVSTPQAPTEAGFLDVPGGTEGVAVAGGLAYVTDDEWGGLRIIDVSNPASPSEAGFYDTPGNALGVAVAGGYAYVADGNAGLRIIDVSNPATPAEVGFLDTPGGVEGVAVAGGFAHLADRGEGLRIIDVSSPTTPVEVGFYDRPRYAWGVTVAGTYAYVADGVAGLRIVSVADPTEPVGVGSYNTPGRASAVEVVEGYAYVADGTGGLRIIDVSNPTTPSEVGFYDTARYADDVAVEGTYAYVADQSGGLVILRYTGSEATPIPSQTVTPTSIYTPATTPAPTPMSTPSPGDPYEPDNTCSAAQAILPDGSPQTHTFHTPGDPDWLRVQAAAGDCYIISALAIGENAHPIIHLYDECGQDPLADSGDTFGFDQIITFCPDHSGPDYLKLTHRDESAYGDDTAYQVSVRPATTGAAIIAGGRLYPNDDLQQQITFMTNRAYGIFLQAGYDDLEDIYYMSADPTPPGHMDVPSSPVTLRHAIQTWAPDHVADGYPLFIYLADHGEQDFFSLDAGPFDKITPEQLDTWLLQFEGLRPNSPVVIIVEACRSGSFITPLGSISRPGRIVVTSAGETTDAFPKPRGQGGAYFSDEFFSALAQNHDLWTSFQKAERSVAEMWGRRQTPWIDGDGDGRPYPDDPDDEGAGRHIGLGRVVGLSGGQAPFIEQPAVPRPEGDEAVLIQVRVLDENPIGMSVWMAVTRPSTPPPAAPPGYITPIVEAERVDLAYNPISGKFEVAFAFDEVGAYQLVFNAKDAGGQRAQAVSVRVARAEVYLPLVKRQ